MPKNLFDKPLYTMVLGVLEEYPVTRNDDGMLYTHICGALGYDLHELSIHSWFAKLDAKQVPSYESVTRLRRLAQMKHPQLRGAAWAKRKHCGEQLHEEFKEQRATPV